MLHEFSNRFDVFPLFYMPTSSSSAGSTDSRGMIRESGGVEVEELLDREEGAHIPGLRLQGTTLIAFIQIDPSSEWWLYIYCIGFYSNWPSLYKPRVCCALTSAASSRPIRNVLFVAYARNICVKNVHKSQEMRVFGDIFFLLFVIVVAVILGSCEFWSDSTRFEEWVLFTWEFINEGDYYI